MNAGKIIGINNVGRAGLRNHFLIVIHCTRFMRGDEGGADIGIIRAHRLRGEHCSTIGNRAGK